MINFPFFHKYKYSTISSTVFSPTPSPIPPQSNYKRKNQAIEDRKKTMQNKVNIILVCMSFRIRTVQTTKNNRIFFRRLFLMHESNVIYLVAHSFFSFFLYYMYFDKRNCFFVVTKKKKLCSNGSHCISMQLVCIFFFF